jgi:PhnB protein
MARKKVKAKAKAKRPAPKRKAVTRSKRVAPIPKGFHTLTPYMCVARCDDALQFYQAAFGAKQQYVLRGPDGRIGHAEIRIGDSILMMSDEHPQMGAFGPKPGERVPVTLHLSVKDADAVVAQAVKAGATIVRPVEDQFYGMRSGMVADPFGYNWFVSTQIEIVTPKEMQKRWNAMLSQMKSEQAA